MEFALQISVPCFNCLGKAKGDKQGDITSLSAHPHHTRLWKKIPKEIQKGGLNGPTYGLNKPTIQLRIKVRIEKSVGM